MIDIRKLLFNQATRKMELLTTPVNRLGLHWKASLLRAPVEKHYQRLKRWGVRLKPNFYLGEDWGCVSGTVNIEAGFYDASAMLKELNREVRGWTNDTRTIDYLLRHETGHAFCYAHRLYKDREFRRVFGVEGKFFETYPATDRFKPHPWSRDFVNPNRDHYAQKHPDEDFAETFGVWLTLPSDWKQAYRNRRGALTKLQYVTKVVRYYGDKPPQIAADIGDVDVPVEAIKRTVAEVLGAPLSKYRRKATGFIDPLLKKVGRYEPRPAGLAMISLADVISAHAKFIIGALTRSAKLTNAQATLLVCKMQTRSRDLHLCVPLSLMTKGLVDIVALGSVLAAKFGLRGALLP
jgi:Putative zinc-binding metallo-peptidase